MERVAVKCIVDGGCPRGLSFIVVDNKKSQLVVIYRKKTVGVGVVVVKGHQLVRSLVQLMSFELFIQRAVISVFGGGGVAN